LINSIEKDMDNKEKVEPARFYTVSKILKMMNITKNYEDKISEENRKFEEDKPKGLTPDVIREIEEKILGITYEENFEHNLNDD